VDLVNTAQTGAEVEAVRRAVARGSPFGSGTWQRRIAKRHRPTLGCDALFEWRRTAEAKSAYLRALAINPGDVRARFNLAFVHNEK